MQSPLVSIVIPVFNGSDFIKEAIDSAINQTYKNIEIIVVNDGSTDHNKTREIALQYGSKIKYYEKSNGGVSSALNLAIKEMKGQYFSWLSHDDLYKNNKIELQIKELQKTTDDKTIIYCDYDLIDINQKIIFSPCLANKHEIRNLNNELYALTMGCINGCAMLINKEIFAEVGLFDEKLLNTQDYDLWFKFFKKNYKIKFIDEVLVSYRIHKKQTSKNPKNRNSLTKECDELWINIIKKLSDSDLELILGNKIKSLSKIFEIRKKTDSQPKACQFIEKEMTTLKKSFCSKINNPKISFIIFDKGSPTKTQKTICSIKQNNHKNFEIFVIQNSPNHLNKTTNYKIIESSSNFTIDELYNIIKNECQGSFINFLDSGDTIKKNKISKQIDFFKENIECDVVYGKNYSFLSLKHFFNKNLTIFSQNPLIQFENFLYFNKHIDISLPSCLFNKDCFKKLSITKTTKYHANILIFNLLTQRKTFKFLDYQLSQTNNTALHSSKNTLLDSLSDKNLIEQYSDKQNIKRKFSEIPKHTNKEIIYKIKLLNLKITILKYQNYYDNHLLNILGAKIYSRKYNGTSHKFWLFGIKI